MLDILQIVLWSLTYIQIIWFGFRNQDDQVQMPYLAGCLNLAWEINGLLVLPFSTGWYGRIVWTVLDIVIFVQNVRKLTGGGTSPLYSTMGFMRNKPVYHIPPDTGWDVDISVCD